MNKIKDFLLILFSLVICLLTALSIGLFISKPKEEITKYIVDVQSDCIDESLILESEKANISIKNSFACCGHCSLEYKVLFNGKDCIALYLDEKTGEYKWFEKIECPFEKQ